MLIVTVGAIEVEKANKATKQKNDAK